MMEGMANPLFSTYHTGENRVTSSMMAVFERIDLALVTEILAAASGAGDEVRSVTFENQVRGDGANPDATISGRFTWHFETKTVVGAYRSPGHSRDQLDRYVKMISGEPDTLLFVVTPDPGHEAPDYVAQKVADLRGRIIWLSFLMLKETITRIIAEAVSGATTQQVSEHTRFLLAELVNLFESEGLCSADDTVVVAARSAWPEYLAVGAYVCQPDRSFRPGLRHLAFYTAGAIQPLVPAIREYIPSVMLSEQEAKIHRELGNGAMANLIEALITRGDRPVGESYGVFLLSGPDDDDTQRLDQPVLNDTTTDSGKPWAWTLSQRYTSFAKLTGGITKTGEL